MSCSHGKTESSCIYCATEKTHNLVAKQTAITAAAAAEQSAFINEQRQKANLRETAESIKGQMRHDYLKLVKEGKNKAIDFGQGEVKLDAADIELYWAEYRESQFLNIETTRSSLNNKRNSFYGNLAQTIKAVQSKQVGINVGFAMTALVVALISGPIAGKGVLIGLVGLAIAAGRSIKSVGMPKSQSEWLPFSLDLVPAFATGLALGSINIKGGAICAIILFIGIKVKKIALERSDEYKSAVSAVIAVEGDLEQLPSPELLTEIRRLN